MRSLAFALLLVAGGVHAQDTTPTLRGANPSWVTTLQAPATGPARLRLAVSASPLLDPDRSVLSVLVDQVPRTTLRLRGRHALNVDLGTLSVGFHRVEVRARLAVTDDPCLRTFEDEAWVRLDQVRFQTARAPRTRRVHVHERIAAMAGDTIAVHPPGTTASPERLSALLDAWITVVRWGGVRARQRPERELWLEHGDVAEGAVGEVSARGEGLQVRAPDDASLAATLRRLRNRALWSRCRSETCVIGASRAADDITPARANAEAEPKRSRRRSQSDRRIERSPSRTIDIEAAQRPDSRVLQLADVGHPRGFNATGSGHHVLEMGWTRPARWRAREWPTFHFEVRAAGTLGDESTATLTLNDVPLATWTLEATDGTPMRLSARVPESLWEDARWEARLTLDVRGRDETECETQGALWVHVAAESRLEVPRDELEHATGLSALDLRGAPLAWNDGWNDEDIERLAANLAMLLAAFADDARPWAWQTQPCPQCVHIRTNAAASSALELVGPEGSRRWRDPTGELEVPLVSAEDTALLARDGETLSIAIIGAPFVAEPPAYSGLVGPIALHLDGAWEVLGEATPVVGGQVEPAAVPELVPIATHREIRARWLNLGTALAALLLIMGFALRWRRA